MDQSNCRFPEQSDNPTATKMHVTLDESSLIMKRILSSIWQRIHNWAWNVGIFFFGGLHLANKINDKNDQVGHILDTAKFLETSMSLTLIVCSY